MTSEALLKIRPANELDCQLLWEWVNEPEVRTSAFESKRVPWSAHVAWFRKKRVDPRCHAFIATDKLGQSVGQVRFDVQNDGNSIIDVSIAHDKRQRGYGVSALRLACRELFRTTACQQVVAYIKTDNVASIQVFKKAEFRDQGNECVKGQSAVKMVLGRKAHE